VPFNPEKFSTRIFEKQQLLAWLEKQTDLSMDNYMSFMRHQIHPNGWHNVEGQWVKGELRCCSFLDAVRAELRTQLVNDRAELLAQTTGRK
jgi:hypothetical protein